MASPEVHCHRHSHSHGAPALVAALRAPGGVLIAAVAMAVSYQADGSGLKRKKMAIAGDVEPSSLFALGTSSGL